MQEFYDNYHRKGKQQKRVISDENFTYRNILRTLNSFHLKRSAMILDIGCGTGTVDFYIASRGNKVEGIDVSSNAIKLAKLNAAHLRLNKKVRFQTMSFPEKTPKRKYDLIIFSEVLEHVQNSNKSLERIYDLMKRRGLVLISTPLKDAPLKRWKMIDYHDRNVGHLRRYTVDSLVRVLHRHDFTIKSVEVREGVLRNALFVFDIGRHVVRLANRFAIISRFLAYVDDFFLKLFGGSQAIVVVKKDLTEK